jgi:hypothetical protein
VSQLCRAPSSSELQRSCFLAAKYVGIGSDLTLFD